MNYWLLKSEPDDYAWDDLQAAGTAVWDGVTNTQAQKNLRAMTRGDRAFFYHTGNQKRIVGLCEVTRSAYPDPGDKAGKLVVVDIKPLRPVPTPVSLADIKAQPALGHLALVRQARLSVVPIDPEAWQHLCQMARVKG